MIFTGDFRAGDHPGKLGCELAAAFGGHGDVGAAVENDDFRGSGARGQFREGGAVVEAVIEEVAERGAAAFFLPLWRWDCLFRA